ncbi:MAG: LPS-assembly protein LptD [Paracoccaceae bacterium]|nr:LPS-assembly protein LptD [Paracoccaceae bacterium]
MPGRPRQSRTAAGLLRPALAALMLAAAAPGVQAQTLPPAPGAKPPVATLVADKVTREGKDKLIASGHVVVLYNGRRLTATSVVYDQTAGVIRIEGPLVLTDSTGKSTAIADSAELSADLKNGILRSAKLVLDERVQFASDEVDRVAGRYTVLGRTVASSCRVCAARPTPLWEIRASKVVHDTVKHEIYFRNARLRFLGIPVLYLPILRVPDPTVTRAPGILAPSFSSSTNFGFGVSLPYFVPLGPSRDVTLTPFIGTKDARSLTMRYRQAFDTGAVEFQGAVSQDSVRKGATRGYLFGSGQVFLPQDFTLKFQVQMVSDPFYLNNYGITSLDRLMSGVEITRTRRDEYVDGQVLQFHSIRSGEDNATLPNRVVTGTYSRRFSPPGIGGQAELSFRGMALVRSSTANGAGRDLTRGGATLDWRRSWVLPHGVLFSAIGSLQGDVYLVGQDSAYAANTIRTLPQLGVELRWPLVRRESGAGRQVLTPIAQVLWSPKNVATVPNEDSQFSEFDAGNLFSTSHFSGIDGVETGLRANVGLAWTRYAPGGWTLGVTAGRIYRQSAATGFDAASGLNGMQSDWLLAGQIQRGGAQIINRAVFGRRSITKNETRLQWTGRNWSVGSSYLWQAAQPATATSAATSTTSEVLFDSSLSLYDRWRITASYHYSIPDHRVESSSLGVTWTNECLSVNVAFSKLFTNTPAFSPTLLTFTLVGFGGRVQGGRPSVCTG